MEIKRDNNKGDLARIEGLGDLTVTPSAERAYRRSSVREATGADLDRCFQIEQALREDRPDAVSQGFLLSGGDTREKYDQFVKKGCFFVAEVLDTIVGFVFVLPPESERLKQLLAGRDNFKMSQAGLFDKPNFAWLAKVAVDPSYMRAGIASSLFRALLTEHNDWNFMTTTVRAPLRNLPSEMLHFKFGFRPVGELPMGDRGQFKNVVCTVHFREAMQELP